jgi:hypothetical protein
MRMDASPPRHAEPSAGISTNLESLASNAGISAELGETPDPGVDLVRGQQAFGLEVSAQTEKFPLCGEAAHVGWRTEDDDAVALEQRNVGWQAFIPAPVTGG